MKLKRREVVKVETEHRRFGFLEDLDIIIRGCAVLHNERLSEPKGGKQRERDRNNYVHSLMLYMSAASNRGVVYLLDSGRDGERREFVVKCYDSYYALTFDKKKITGVETLEKPRASNLDTFYAGRKKKGRAEECKKKNEDVKWLRKVMEVASHAGLFND